MDFLKTETIFYIDGSSLASSWISNWVAMSAST